MGGTIFLICKLEIQWGHYGVIGGAFGNLNILAEPVPVLEPGLEPVPGQIGNLNKVGVGVTGGTGAS